MKPENINKNRKREVERRRTFGIISHPNAGKTTLTYMAESKWQLNYTAEKWPEIDFLKIREYQ